MLNSVNMPNSQTTRSATYIAVIGDIVGSRARDDRADLQDRLLAACADVNDGSTLIAPLRMTSGDEFEALATTDWGFTSMLVAMEAAAWPSLVSFGLGFGELATDLPTDPHAVDVGALDGPAFHRARAALEQANANDTWFAAAGFPAAVEPLLNSIGELLGVLRRAWTDRQREMLLAAARHQGTRKALAARFDVSPSVVTETLRAAEFGAFERATVHLDQCWPVLENSPNQPNSDNNSAK